MPGLLVEAVPNTIPAVAPPAVAPGRSIVFSGNLEYHPNAAAVRYFHSRVWPLLKQREPKLVWRIVGKNPGALPREVVAGDGVEVVGAAPDAIAELARSQVAVVPVLSGSGTRVKILEAWAAGAASIVALDVAPQKLELARTLGATACVDAAAGDAIEQVKRLTAGGVDFAFEFAGAVKALELAYRITRRGGTTVTAGLPPPTATLPLPIVNLVAEERTVKGSYIGTCVPARDLPRYVALYRQGRLPVDKLKTGTLRLEQINEGFDRLREGHAVRQVVVL